MTRHEYFTEPVLILPQHGLQTDKQKNIMADVRKKYLDLRMMSTFLKLKKGGVMATPK